MRRGETAKSRSKVKKCVGVFEMVNFHAKTIHPGELYLSRKPCKISTLLGSCVAVCVHNKDKLFGGMNHYMLPRKSKRAVKLDDYRFGDVSIRTLLDKMLLIDPDPDNVVVKIFGGGMVVPALEKANIGQENVKIAREIIEEYGLTIENECVELKTGLKIIFNNYTNQVFVKRIRKEERTEELIETREEKIARILSAESGIDLLGEG